jgi:thymidylate kinase
MEVPVTAKKAKKVLIVFSGLDGSGKSTLVSKLKNENPHYKIIKAIDFRLINCLFKKTIVSRKKKSHNMLKGEGFLNLSLLFFDIILFKLYYFLSREPVVCDRYFYDIIAVHVHRYGKSKVLDFFLYNNLIPKPNLAFFIYVEHKIARKREKGDSHSLEYFNSLRSIYGELYIEKKAYCLKHNDEINDTFNSIKKEIAQLHAR